MFQGIHYIFRLVYKLEKNYIISLFIMEIMTALLTVVSVILPKYIVDALFGGARLFGKAVAFLTVYVVVTVIVNSLIAMLKYWSEKSRDSLYTKYSILQGKKFLNASYTDLEDPRYLTLREKAAKYMNAYGFAGIIAVTLMLIGKLVTIISLISIIISMDYKICFIFFAITFINLISSIHNKKRIIDEDMNMVDAERRRDYVKSIFESPQYAKEIRSYGIKEWLLKKYQKEYDTTNNYKRKQNLYKMKNKMLNLITDFVQQVVMYSYLLWCAMIGRITVGNFTMYLSGIIVFNNAVLEMVNIIVDLKQYNDYFEPFKQFEEYFENQEDGDVTPAKSEHYMIEFKNVYFKYPGQDEYALKNVNVKMSTKETICIVGENGAGKSTFIKLLLRLYKVEEGEILLNGVNIQEYAYDEYVKCFSVLFQDFKLFALSVKDNVMLNNALDSQSLDWVLELSGVEEMLRVKKKKSDVSVSRLFDEEGIDFSGGEKQKIALARALYKNAPILLLDEPTSALDSISEADLLMKFSDVAKDKMVIFISHRLTSAKICNRIIVFNKGMIVEDGNHEDLLQQKGIYFELYQMQAGLYKEKGKVNV